MFTDRDSGQGTKSIAKTANAAFTASLTGTDTSAPADAGKGTVGFIQAQLTGGVTNRQAACATFPLKGSVTTLKITAVNPGPNGNGAFIRFLDVGMGAESVDFDSTQGPEGTLTFQIHPATTTAAQIRDLLNTKQTICLIFTASLSSNSDNDHLLDFYASPSKKRTPRQRTFILIE